MQQKLCQIFWHKHCEKVKKKRKNEMRSCILWYCVNECKYAKMTKPEFDVAFYVSACIPTYPISKHKSKHTLHAHNEHFSHNAVILAVITPITNFAWIMNIKHWKMKPKTLFMYPVSVTLTTQAALFRSVCSKESKEKNHTQINDKQQKIINNENALRCGNVNKAKKLLLVI